MGTGGTGEISVSSSQFYCKPEIAMKNEVLKKNLRTASLSSLFNVPAPLPNFFCLFHFPPHNHLLICDIIYSLYLIYSKLCDCFHTLTYMKSGSVL